MKNRNTTLDGGTDETAGLPSEQKVKDEASPASPKSKNSTLAGETSTQENNTTSDDDVTTEEALTTTVIEAVPSVRDKILGARKAPEEVARLVSTQKEQLTLPVYHRPPDGVDWRVRTGGEWDPQACEVLLMRRKEGGSGPEFLMVLPELEPLFNGNPRLRNLVKYYYLAFVVDTRGRFGWWAISSRSEETYGVSARAAMRKLASEWAMVKTDLSAKVYYLEKPQEDLGKPVWPDGSYDDWLVKGFSDKLLDSEDHPVLRELQGRK